MLNLVPPASVGLNPKQLDRVAAHLDRYVDDGKLPGYLVLVARQGQPAYLRAYGLCDVENHKPVAEDTIFRIYSMTKPITSIAIMQLYERGLFQLDNPVSRFIPAFKELRVFAAGDAEKVETVATSRPVTFRDLLTHTAGFAYGTSANHVVDQLYRERKVLSGTLEEMIQKLSELPLLFDPEHGGATASPPILKTEIYGEHKVNQRGCITRWFFDQIVPNLILSGEAHKLLTILALPAVRRVVGLRNEEKTPRLILR